MYKSENDQIIFLSIAAILLTVAWIIPSAKIIFYPLTLIATWFHEIGHAAATYIIGGRVHGIEIFSNLSGVTYSLFPLNIGTLQQAFVVAAGPVMPSILGALLILSGRSGISSKVALWILAGGMFFSAVFLGNASMGMILIGIFAWGLGYSAMKLNEEVLRLFTQILGIEGAISIFASFNYLSNSNIAVINGQEITSDTQYLASLVGGGHFFWALLLSLISIAIMVLSLLFSLNILGRKNAEVPIESWRNNF